jgi:hypothetical protein
LGANNGRASKKESQQKFHVIFVVKKMENQIGHAVLAVFFGCKIQWFLKLLTMDTTFPLTVIRLVNKSFYNLCNMAANERWIRLFFPSFWNSFDELLRALEFFNMLQFHFSGDSAPFRHLPSRPQLENVSFMFSCFDQMSRAFHNYSRKQDSWWGASKAGFLIGFPTVTNAINKCVFVNPIIVANKATFSPPKKKNASPVFWIHVELARCGGSMTFKWKMRVMVNKITKINGRTYSKLRWGEVERMFPNADNDPAIICNQEKTKRIFIDPFLP